MKDANFMQYYLFLWKEIICKKILKFYKIKLQSLGKGVLKAERMLSFHEHCPHTA